MAPRVRRSPLARTTFAPLLVALGAAGCAHAEPAALYAQAGDEAMAAKDYARATVAYEQAKSEDASAKADRARLAWLESAVAAHPGTSRFSPDNPFASESALFELRRVATAGGPAYAAVGERIDAKIRESVASTFRAIVEHGKREPMDAVLMLQQLRSVAGDRLPAQAEMKPLVAPLLGAVMKSLEALAAAAATKDEESFVLALATIISGDDPAKEKKQPWVWDMAWPGLVVIGGDCVRDELGTLPKGSGPTFVLDASSVSCSDSANSASTKDRRIVGYDETVVRDEPSVSTQCSSSGPAYGGSVTSTNASEGTKTVTSTMYGAQKSCRTYVTESSHVERTPRYADVTTDTAVEYAKVAGTLRLRDGKSALSAPLQWDARSVVVNGRQLGSVNPKEGRRLAAYEAARALHKQAIGSRATRLLAAASSSLSAKDEPRAARDLLHAVALGGKVPSEKEPLGLFAQARWSVSARMLSGAARGERPEPWPFSTLTARPTADLREVADRAHEDDRASVSTT